MSILLLGVEVARWAGQRVGQWGKMGSGWNGWVGMGWVKLFYKMGGLDWVEMGGLEMGRNKTLDLLFIGLTQIKAYCRKSMIACFNLSVIRHNCMQNALHMLLGLWVNVVLIMFARLHNQITISHVFVWVVDLNRSSIAICWLYSNCFMCSTARGQFCQDASLSFPKWSRFSLWSSGEQ